MKTIVRGTLVDDRVQDILIEGSKISRIAPALATEHPDARLLDGGNTAALPFLVNAHTHSPMVLLRGAGDDLPLHEWLSERIWPLERLFTEEDYYWGNRLAFAEMVRSGTGFFNEMYFSPRTALRALADFPMKACICFPLIDGMDEEAGRRQAQECERFFEEVSPPAGVSVGIALHSVYAASRYSIEWARDFAAERGLMIHLHLSETAREVADCRSAHGGQSPPEYLDGLGVLSNRVVAAHGVHLSDRDIELLAERGVTVVHNPGSNMKLASGVFPYRRLSERGVRVLLATDGAASNNNLDMFEEMKLAALLQKVDSGDATVMTAGEVWEIATTAGAEHFATGGGSVSEGAEADLMLVDLATPGLVPRWDLTSSLVYGANGSCVRSLLCGGRVLMENRLVEGYEEITRRAEDCARGLASRSGGRPAGGTA